MQTTEERFAALILLEISSPEVRMSTASSSLMQAAAMGNATSDSMDVYWSVPTRVVLSMTMLIIMTVAIVGNVLVITVVVRNRGMRTRTNMFLCNLAIADLLCAVFDMPFSLVTVIGGKWMFHGYKALCQLNGFLMPFFFVASIHTLMYTSVHKYLSISRPLSVILTKSRILFLIAMTWAWAGLTSTLTVTVTRVDYKPYTTQCGPEIPDDPKAYAHLAFVLVTCYAAPLAIILFCYYGLFRQIRKLGGRLELTTTTDRQAILGQQRRILRTLVLILVVFIVSWTPWVLYSIYVTIIGTDTAANRLANPITYWFGYLNSACNPIIYAFRSEAFRQGYAEALCQRPRKGSKGSTESSEHLSYSASEKRKIGSLEFPWQLRSWLSGRLLSRPTEGIQPETNEKRLSTYSLPERLNFGLTQKRSNVLTPSRKNLVELFANAPPPSAPAHLSTVDEHSPGGAGETTATRKHSQGGATDETMAMPKFHFLPRYTALDWQRLDTHGSNSKNGKSVNRVRKPVKHVDNDKVTITIGSSSVPNSTERDVDANGGRPTAANHWTVKSGSVGIQPEILPARNSWRKRISQKWKRRSHKTSAHPDPEAASGVRRSATVKAHLVRCPSVERLDRRNEPCQRHRTRTEIPDAYRRKRHDRQDLLIAKHSKESLGQVSRDGHVVLGEKWRETEQIAAVQPRSFPAQGVDNPIDPDDQFALIFVGRRRTLSAPCSLNAYANESRLVESSRVQAGHGRLGVAPMEVRSSRGGSTKR